ncbi:MAG: DUF3422 domain-containing protein, partial [Dokdonella sp.]|nr:DUF3422 domain-containing protein [Betaproteobacteria bacterium]
MPDSAVPESRHALAVACIGAATDHHARDELANEVHARPFLRIETPARVTHLAILAASDQDAEIHARLAADFCTALEIPPPAPGARHLTHSGAGLQIKWERHTEFSTLTVVGPGGGQDPFAAWNDPALQAPLEWTGRVAGKRLAALQIEVLKGEAASLARDHLERWFVKRGMVGSRVLGSGEVWCDWQIGSDGFSRFLVLDLGFRENQVGRLVQRLAEIETYRLMALLALPIARGMLGQLEQLDAALGEVMCRMASGHNDLSGHSDADLLLALTELAGKVEGLSSGASRFSAARAYDQLVLARIQELREERIEGVPTIGEFMERRLSPAMDTCRSVQQRQADLAVRIARAIDLLRTRVNLVQERQVTELLSGMNRTASTQLKLQHAVEGLSVVAISYYAVSLISHILSALNELGLRIHVAVAEMFLIPVVLLLSFLMVRGVRRRLTKTP